ncbi:MAG: hypothetical protein Q9225_002725 [Loekoesia sp. 1 TL-2023]
MVGKLFLQSQLLPVESISLARFVVDIASPQRRFHDPILDYPPQSLRNKQHDFKEHAQRYNNAKAGGRLTQLLQMARGVEGSLEAHVSATASISHELCQWDAVFRDACASPVTRKWIEDAIEDSQDIYFVVGFRTFVDPSAFETISRSSIKGGEVQVPVSEVVQANVPGLALEGVLDPGVNMSTTRARQNVQSFAIDGEMIYAVQYCKVNFKWYSSRTLETGFLGKTRWHVHWGVRASDENVEDDVVEAAVEEADHFATPYNVGDLISLD